MYAIESKSEKRLTILLMDSKKMFNDRVRCRLNPGEVKEISDEQYCKELQTLEKKRLVAIHYFEDKKEEDIVESITDKIKPVKRSKKSSEETKDSTDTLTSISEEIGG